MQCVRELTDLDTSDLCAFLDVCAQPFETSQLYVAADGKKVVDETERCSRFRAIKDPNLFAIAERLVEHVSESDAQRNYSLVRNDVHCEPPSLGSGPVPSHSPDPRLGTQRPGTEAWIRTARSHRLPTSLHADPKA